MIVQFVLGIGSNNAPVMFPVEFNGRCRVKVVKIDTEYDPADDIPSLLRFNSRILKFIYYLNTAENNYIDRFVLEDVDIGGHIDLLIENADGTHLNDADLLDTLLTLDIEYMQ